MDLNRLPPRWFRRLVLAPVVFGLAVVLVVASPVIHLVAAVADLIIDRRRWRISRLVGMGLAFCVGEAFGLFALFTVWVGSGFGLFMNRPFWAKANHILASQYLAMVTNAVVFFLGVDFRASFDESPKGPQLLFARHAGPGDAFRLMKIVTRDLNRRCHAVGAAKLQWDPFLDVAGERLRFHFLKQSPDDTQAELRNIAALAASLEANDTLVIYPEGGNYTPKRREARIKSERTRGRQDRAELAESLKHTLLPKTGGVLAAIEGAPKATITFLGHAGLDDIHGLRTMWETMPLRRTVVAKGWNVELLETVTERQARSQWLMEQWKRVDDWIDETLRSGATHGPLHPRGNIPEA